MSSRIATSEILILALAAATYLSCNSAVQSNASASFSFVSSAKADDEVSDVKKIITKILDDKSTSQQGILAPKVSVTAMSEEAAKITAHVCFMSRDNLVKLSEALNAPETPELVCLDRKFIQPKQNTFSTILVPSGAIAVMVNGELFAINKPEISIGIDVAEGPTLTDDIFWLFGGRRTETIARTTARELK